MRYRRKIKKERSNAPIQTTFFDLIEELSQLTEDDSLVIAAVKNIFKFYSVRSAHSLAPVSLVVRERADQ